MNLAYQLDDPLYVRRENGQFRQGNTMIDALRKLLTNPMTTLPDENTVAIGLLMEVVRMDDDFDAAERAAIRGILTRRFGASEAEVADLMSLEASKPPTTYDDNQLFKQIHTSWSKDQKAGLIEILWEIALADGELHRFENHAILAIANQLGMGQADLDATKAAAKARLAD